VIRIPVGETLRVTLARSTWKAVTCYKCASQFAYCVRYEASGVELNPLWLAGERAQQVALREAEKRLPAMEGKAIGYVPCPMCGHVQADMTDAQSLIAIKELATRLLGTFVVGVTVIGLVQIFGGSRLLSIVVALALSTAFSVWRFRGMSELFSPKQNWHPKKAFSTDYPVLLRDEYAAYVSPGRGTGSGLPDLTWPAPPDVR